MVRADEELILTERFKNDPPSIWKSLAEDGLRLSKEIVHDLAERVARREQLDEVEGEKACEKCL
jgi:hypothetical protein